MSVTIIFCFIVPNFLFFILCSFSENWYLSTVVSYYSMVDIVVKMYALASPWEQLNYRCTTTCSPPRHLTHPPYALIYLALPISVISMASI